MKHNFTPLTKYRYSSSIYAFSTICNHSTALSHAFSSGGDIPSLTTGCSRFRRFLIVGCTVCIPVHFDEEIAMHLLAEKSTSNEPLETLPCSTKQRLGVRTRTICIRLNRHICAFDAFLHYCCLGFVSVAIPIEYTYNWIVL